MKRISILIIFLAGLLLTFQPARAQSDAPLVIIMKVEGPIIPAMQDYIARGLKTADQRGAQAVIIEMNTPGGAISSMQEIIQDIRASNVPVVVYVTPNGAMAGSAGALITMAAHVSAMSPEAVIGAASPIDSGGQNIESTLQEKIKEIMKATIRPLVERRGSKALQLAQDMVEKATAVTAKEAYEAKLIDFIANDRNDLLNKLDGFTIRFDDKDFTFHTAQAQTEPIDMSLLERFLLLLTDPNISFILLAIGVQAIIIEISSPGGWAAGFIGAVCITLAAYGMGILPVNWFGILFLLMAFVLFILDIKAPTHGALTTAGVASFIVGALMLFNSPGTPQFQRVSVPLVVGTGIFIGLMFFGILVFALRAQRAPARMGAESLLGKTGTARTVVDEAGQVQLESELWSAEKSPKSDPIGKGDHIQVVEVRGLRLIVKKK
ncbi:MAG: nodulation protein NfeD [Anaerolineales bacterium]|nr:nodulation protein NfeD [Anaerolineales bacterium]